MSVKAHEAYCLDSAQDRLLFYDDFLGDSLRDLWAVSGTGSAAVVDAQDGGIVRVTSGATSGNQYLLNWGTIRTLHVNKKVTLEVRAKYSSGSELDTAIRLRYDANNHVSFFYDRAAPGHWVIVCRNDTLTSAPDSGVLIDTDYHIYRIECFPTGEVHFYIDGTECANSPITTNIPSDAGDYLEVYFEIETSEDVAKSMDIDYVVIRQDR